VLEEDFTVIPFWLLTAMTAAPPPMTTGDEVVRAAYAKYSSTWYRTATFIQNTTLTDGKHETWYTAMQLPGQLRIDVGPSLTGRALIFRNDSMYQYGAKKLRGRGPYPHAILILSQDLHVEAPDRTIGRLRRLGFDFSRTHEESWQGKPVFVVGALKGALRSSQFWVEKERMLVVRIIQANGADPTRPLDARFDGYVRAGQGWIESQLTLILGGQVIQKEEYTQVKTGVALEPGLFDPGSYHLPAWVGQADDIFGKLPGIPPGAKRAGGG